MHGKLAISWVWRRSVERLLRNSSLYHNLQTFNCIFMSLCDQSVNVFLLYIYQRVPVLRYYWSVRFGPYFQLQCNVHKCVYFTSSLCACQVGALHWVRVKWELAVIKRERGGALFFPIANCSDLCGETLITRCVSAEGEYFTTLEPKLSTSLSSWQERKYSLFIEWALSKGEAKLYDLAKREHLLASYLRPKPLWPRGSTSLHSC